jgi:transketolase C-terminal domain/subunit
LPARTLVFRLAKDGPSQMALEDLSMMRSVHGCAVLYPCDAVSTERLVVEMAKQKGLAYMRTSRPKTPVIYGPTSSFQSVDRRSFVRGATIRRRSSGSE